MKRRELKLTSDERAWLEQFTGAGSAQHQAFKRAQILLAADEPNRMGDTETTRAIGVSKATVYNTRSHYLALGVEATVHRKACKDKGIPEKVHGRVEAHIAALACSATPNEEPVWTLTMLADKLVELERAGWRVNRKRVECIWRQEGLKVPARQAKRGRLWLGDGSCLRLRPEHPNHVWAYDFVTDRTTNGKAFRMLTVVDEFTRECLAVVVDRKRAGGLLARSPLWW